MPLRGGRRPAVSASEDQTRKLVRSLLQLPAMQQWYAEGLAEPWRDADHEREIQAVGTVLEDLRA